MSQGGEFPMPERNCIEEGSRVYNNRKELCVESGLRVHHTRRVVCEEESRVCHTRREYNQSCAC